MDGNEIERLISA